MSKIILKLKPIITPEQLYEAIQKVEIKRNRRKNVSDEPCQSRVIGQYSMYNEQGGHMTKLTEDYPEFWALLKGFMEQNASDFEWTTATLNKNLQCKVHKDSYNVGDSMIIGLGTYQGGDFHIETEDGYWVAHDIHNRLVKFNGRMNHCTEPFTGTRYSIVFFNHK